MKMKNENGEMQIYEVNVQNKKMLNLTFEFLVTSTVFIYLSRPIKLW